MTPPTQTELRPPAVPPAAAPAGGSPGLPPFDPEHGAIAEGAADALELAALLEAEGLTDARVRGDFGHADVFSYAEDLFAATRRRTVEVTRTVSEWTFSPARSTARLAPILTVLFLQAVLGDHLGDLSRGELAAALVVPMLGSALVLGPAGYLGSRYVVCGYMRPGAVAALRLLWIGTALVALGVVGGAIAGASLGVLGSSWSFAAVGLVSAALWALITLLLTLEKPRHVHGTVAGAVAVGFLVASLSDVTIGAVTGAIAFAALGSFAVALSLLRSPPMSTRVPPLRRQARSLFPAAFYGVLGPVIVLADWPASQALGLDRSSPAALTTGATFAVLAAVLLYELNLTRLQGGVEGVLAATPVGADERLVGWTGSELVRRRRRSLLGVAVLVVGVAAAVALLAGGGEALTAADAALLATSVAAYATIGVVHGELLVLVWLGRPGPAIAIQAIVAAVALAASFPAVALLGLWGAPALFLLACPLGVVLARRATARAVADGAYSFYRAAF
jgi:hypothetical protein